MKATRLAEHYFAWHYGRAYTDLYRVWMNFIWFFFNFFAINLLLSTLFQPWKRMGEDYPAGFNPSRIFQTFVVNALMRFVGATVRLMVVAIGLSLASLAFAIGLIIILLWTVMPVFFVALIIVGLSLIIYG